MGFGDLWRLLGLLFFAALPFSWSYTYEPDVFAMNNLYVALGSPPIPGWIPNGGDPCLENWQGVECVDANITAIVLNAANLGGMLGDSLGNFSSIITINLSNNHIGGSIPENLPITMRQLFLSANQFTGSIPSSLAGLSLLSAMSLNNNLLTGPLPDAFDSLSSLTNLDLSSNNLSGPLPPSMQSLSSLTTMRIQNNQFSGKLDVLQDLSLKDLNVENNLFSGPIPTKLFNIPDFKSDGNPFNTTIAPTPSVPPTLSPPRFLPPPDVSSKNTSSGSNTSGAETSASPRQTKKSSTKIVLIAVSAVATVVVLVFLVVAVLSCIMSKHRKNSEEGFPKRDNQGTYERPRVEPKAEPRVEPKVDSRIEPGVVQRVDPWMEARVDPRMEARVEPKVRPMVEPTVEPKVEPRRNISLAIPNNVMVNSDANKEEPEDYVIGSSGVVLLPPPPVDQVIVNPVNPPETAKKVSERAKKVPSSEYSKPPTLPKSETPTTSAISFSVASLQQYTNSFSETNLIREDRLGKAYRADLPDGKKLMVIKLHKGNSTLSLDGFLELVVKISEFRHPNILELVGYCAEYGQQLLVYNFLSKRSLHDILHDGDDLKGKLSWNARIQVAFGAAKALEYLHEDCQPSVIHQNFESSNVLLDDELTVRVSGCGLASIISSHSVAQLADRLQSLSHEAPEISESGTCTDRSDVYSFGVVMLELLTGREPYDSSRPRAEQYLVRWASSQLHDINTLLRMVDPAINRKCPVKSLSRFADIISRCILREPEFRPPMSEVVQDLNRMVDEINKRKGGDSRPGSSERD